MGVKGDPNNVQWCNTRGVSNPDAMLTMVLSNKTLFFYNPKTPDAPMELAFQARYGNIVTYHWFGDGYIMIGFSTGYFVVISTNMNEIGQELFQSRDFKDLLNDIALSTTLNKAATCGDNCIKIHDLTDLKDVSDIITLEDDRGQLDKIQWSEDGQFLSISTKLGSVHNYLSRLPVIGSVYGSSVAFLSSLLEVTITDQSLTSEISSGSYIPSVLLRKQLEIEPTITALGPYNVGNNSNPNSPADDPGAIVFKKVNSKEYHANVVGISLSEVYAAIVLQDGRMVVHRIDGSGDAKIFPDKKKIVGAVDSTSDLRGNLLMKINCAKINSDLLIFGTNDGMLIYYTVIDWILVSELKHKIAIRKIYPNPKGGTKIIFRDAINEAFIFTPTTDFLMPIPSMTETTQDIAWERSPKNKRHLFISWDDDFITVYVYHQNSVKGPQCLALGATKLPFGLKPILLCDGVLTCQTTSGKLSIINLSTHEIHKDIPNLNEQDQGKYLQLLYTIGKNEELWSCLEHITSKKSWVMVTEAALQILDVATALRVYREVLGNAGMVLTLQELQEIEDRNLLKGHIAVLFGDYNLAQEYMLDSSHPSAALELRRDLRQFDQALALALKLAPEELSEIARDYAQQLEFGGRYSEALTMYEKSLSNFITPSKTEEELSEHQIACSSGLARMTLMMGDISRGMKMLAEATDRRLLLDCANILEGIKQFPESGLLLERAHHWEKAAEMYIKAKNWTKVGILLPKVTSSKVLTQYAKAKEVLGQFTEAAIAYEKARDFDNVVRIYVENLQNIDGAVSIVRKTRSREAAKMVSKYFQSVKDFKSVVEFFLMANMKDEAFALAQQHDVMEYYAEIIKDEASNELSTYFENKMKFIQAGKFLMQATNYPRALKMFLESSVKDGTPIELAIETVGLAKNDALTHELIDFLMGEIDGVPKDAKYIFKLYMSLGQFKEASRTAIIIAREEQTLGEKRMSNLGNYRAAHDLLLDNFKQLRARKVTIPSEIERMLMILHSYILVKSLIKIDEHEMGARMLIRVSNNISKFPAHVVPILTSTVIECYRAGLKKSSFEYAAMLMRPEYRQKIDNKYKRKIEQIIRRPEQIEEDEPSSPCPYCNSLVLETQLNCSECKNTIPFCIATGKHMNLNHWSLCPHCQFPAILPYFKLVIAKTNCCPMCSTSLNEEEIFIPPNPLDCLRSLTSEKEEDNYVKIKKQNLEIVESDGENKVTDTHSSSRKEFNNSSVNFLAAEKIGALPA
ncbi:WD repeat-containing protein 19 [Nowakowskiella sp. JEL0078]|nr:WD repeat-containing protein 19 [Nowakowskiella sp. JEL0078]